MTFREMAIADLPGEYEALGESATYEAKEDFPKDILFIPEDPAANNDYPGADGRKNLTIRVMVCDSDGDPEGGVEAPAVGDRVRIRTGLFAVTDVKTDEDQIEWILGIGEIEDDE